MTVLAYGEESYVLKLKPDDENIAKKLNEFLLLKNVGRKVVDFSPGVYYLDQSLFLNSNTILRGDSAAQTTLVFDLKGKGNCINIKGSREKSISAVRLNYQSGLDKPDFDLEDLYKIYNASPEGVGLSAWGKESLGEVIPGSLVKGQLLITKRLYDIEKDVLGDSILCYKLNYVSGISIQDLTIVRKDNSEGQTSNIYVQYARACQIIDVESNYCNYSHVTIENSHGVLVNHCKFKNAFDHGNGGKAYGVTLQYGATANEVSGCLFDSLRHGVVLQLGANNNFIFENYFKNGFWTDVSLPKRAAGDIVLHGNYPFLNFIQGNICNNIVIDHSHGLNGPGNLFEHNKTLLFGVYMNRNAVDGITYFLDNYITKAGCFKGKLKLANNQVESCNNEVKGRLKKNRGGCENSSTNEYMARNVQNSTNEATQYFRISLPED
ncbi:hypothetical protein [Parvicella tangerina]|uniref:Uncharacterized protein n=1 Tax=Parvicella tangerina TaxID=2829795 RepID=A0A916JNV0_9FLAO|nr:hypothetical protein [Parvicella tangerina]CAG5084125.1 hypothetical protein CRYO30217_02382 [Parvicella tangerina]